MHNMSITVTRQQPVSGSSPLKASRRLTAANANVAVMWKENSEPSVSSGPFAPPPPGNACQMLFTTAFVVAVVIMAEIAVLAPKAMAIMQMMNLFLR